MKLTCKQLLVSTALVTAVAIPGLARAGDFATCDADLPACTADLNDCCYRSFDASGSDKAIIIPMDRCHQKLATAGTEAPPGSNGPASTGGGWCLDTPSSADNGMYEAYGLVYRLMQHGIPVHWVIDPTKKPTAIKSTQFPASNQIYITEDIDFWVLDSSTTSVPDSSSALNACGVGCNQPIARLNASTLAPVANSYNYKEFPVRGGAFVIAPEDRAAFNAFWKHVDDGAGNDYSALAGDSRYSFPDIDLYELSSTAYTRYSDYRTFSATGTYPAFNSGGNLPVATRIDYSPPRLARLGTAAVSSLWLGLAGLDDPADSSCKTGGDFEDHVYCTVTEEDIRQGALISGAMDWAWLDNWSDNSPCGNDLEIAQVEKVEEFMTHVPGLRAGGHVMFMEAAVGVVEGCADHQPLGVVGSGVGLATSSVTPTENLIFRNPNSVFMQWGDLPMVFASGSVAKWFGLGSGGNGYDTSKTSLTRLISIDSTGGGSTTCTNHVSSGSCDVFVSSGDVADSAVYGRYQDDSENGLIFYMGGNNVVGRSAHLRMIMNSLIAVPNTTPEPVTPTVDKEVSRASPILATVNGVEAQYQGTYELLDPQPSATSYSGSESDATFEFPFRKGHVRAVPTSAIGSSATDFTALASSAIFDAADGIPAVDTAGCSTNFTSGCRTVFTTIEQPDTDGLVSKPDKVYFGTNNETQLKALLEGTTGSFTDDEAKTLISRVLAGVPDGSGGYQAALGGVDRSTVAVIEPSPLASGLDGSLTRPTMVYFGATDGMLHAVCADTVAPCTAVGQELWAYLPRTQLPLLKKNSQRLDGSPKVADIFDDTDGDGKKDWATVLTFQTGSGTAGTDGAQPSVVAIDITDPDNPFILWERSSPPTRGSVDQGTGIGLAMGPVRVSSQFVNMTFIETNNGGTGQAGFAVQAVDTVSGAVQWEDGAEYPNPRTNTNPEAPTTGIPGGAVAVDREGLDTITHVVFADLYGRLWLYDATTGANVHGSNPLFSFSTDYHPIGASPTVYSDASTGQINALVVSGGYDDPISTSWSPDTTHQYAVAVSLNATAVPITDTGSFGDDRAFVIDLGAGNRAFSQAVIAGNELFIATDSADINGAAYGTGGSTGLLGRYSLDDGSAKSAATTITGGASSVTVAEGGIVYTGSGSGAQKTDFSGSFNATGGAMELYADENVSRILWLAD